MFILPLNEDAPGIVGRLDTDEGFSFHVSRTGVGADTIGVQALCGYTPVGALIATLTQIGESKSRTP